MNASKIPAETLNALLDIGTIAGILRDIAAREITESKKIEGVSVDMLARMIERHVEQATGGAEPAAVQS
ncbi:hypothetical protein ACMS1Z_06815 [Acidiphilium multivorum]|uniref:hypothetical protein n=1 Tax=Acidiphilium multivorum TaxID=62140 RepID=UPI0039C9C6B0